MFSLKNLQKSLFGKLRLLSDLMAKKKIQQNKGLWAELTSYLEKTGSTGCSFGDYLVLYTYIREKKPVEVLECATGVSTIVMAYAMMENEKETGVVGRIASMEESLEYYDLACRLLPPGLKKYVEIIHSPKAEAFYYLFRGVKYEKVPRRAYDFVFIDGPTTKSLSDGHKTFDFDFIDVLLNSEKPVSAVVDGRLSTCFVLGKILGRDKFKYDNIKSLGFAHQCMREDLLTVGDFINSYRDLN